MKEELYDLADLADHIARSKGALPPVWQDLASEIEMAVRKMANREAQPVALNGWRVTVTRTGDRQGVASISGPGVFCMEVPVEYSMLDFMEAISAPLAPAVPPEQHWEELCLQHPNMSIGDAIIRAAWWNHCRAAMLAQPVSQRYKLNSPVIPDGWVSCEDRMPEEGDVVLVCQEGGIIYCAEMQDGELYPDEFPRVPSEGREITHWMPLPAAPEGGNG